MANKKSDFVDAIKSINPITMATSQQFLSGPPIDPLTRILGYDSAEWELFIEEWLYSLNTGYEKVLRFTGPGDKGIDVAGFYDNKELDGNWDNFQCKHYKNPLGFSNVGPEIGKILWHSFNGHFKAPQICNFIAPRGASTSLSHLLANAPNLKQKVFSVWEKSISKKIISGKEIALEGKFKEYFDNYNFGSFIADSPRNIIEQHKKTQFYIARFGGGLPCRPAVTSPPVIITSNEERYTTQLFEAYSENKKEKIQGEVDLKKWPPIKKHFGRSREAFYHAEALRIFVRDKTETGTFESLQEEIFDGVIDTHDKEYSDGFERLTEVTKSAQNLSLDAHPLNTSTFIKDRHGICHQLANKDRLKWKK